MPKRLRNRSCWAAKSRCHGTNARCCRYEPRRRNAATKSSIPVMLTPMKRIVLEEYVDDTNLKNSGLSSIDRRYSSALNDTLAGCDKSPYSLRTTKAFSRKLAAKRSERFGKSTVGRRTLNMSSATVSQLLV